MRVARGSLRTLDDVDARGKKVFLRVDMNLPLNPVTWEILDGSRITKSMPTINQLSGAAVVVASHQSRPMRGDFSSMEKHADMIREASGRRVTFVPDVVGPAALDAISRLKPGEILVLDNLRLCAEENYEARPEVLVRTHLCRRLAPLFDIYVNDAFAASHRCQASLAGLPRLLDPYAGRLMESELLTISRVLETAASPRVLCLGGAKLETKLKLLEEMLQKDRVDEVLISGLAGIVFLEAAGHEIGRANQGAIETSEQLLSASRILEKYPERVFLPSDVAVVERGRRVECTVGAISNRAIMDIGPETMETFSDHLSNAKSIFANGPTGFFEMEGFEKGTVSLLLAIAMSKAKVKLLGGGHLGALAEEMGMSKNVHISTGGGALLALLGDQEIPSISLLTKEGLAGRGG